LTLESWIWLRLNVQLTANIKVRNELINIEFLTGDDYGTLSRKTILDYIKSDSLEIQKISLVEIYWLEMEDPPQKISPLWKNKTVCSKI